MAIVSAQAKLYTGIRCWCVDKNISASLSSSFSLGNYNRPLQPSNQFVLSANVLPQRLKKTYTDLFAVSTLTLTDERYKTYGGGNKAGVNNPAQPWIAEASLTCEFPTYIQIDVEKLGLPEGTDVVLHFEEGWVLEDRGRQLPSGAWEYPAATQSAPSPAQEEFVSFRTPWFGVGRLVSAASLNYNIQRRRPGAATVSASTSVYARGIFNPGKLSAIEVNDFVMTSNAIYKASAFSTMYSSFGPKNVGGMPELATAFRIYPLQSVLTLSNVMSANADKFKTPGIVALTNTVISEVSGDRTIGPITADIESSATMSVDIMRIVGVDSNITASTSQNSSAFLLKGLIQNLTVTSSLSSTISIAMILETTADFIYLPIMYGSVNCSIDWGDGTSTTLTTTNGSQISHTFASGYGSGITKQIKISGYIQHFGFASTANVPDWNATGSSAAGLYWTEQLRKIVSFGDLGTETFISAFSNPRNLTGGIPTRLPSTITDISGMFQYTRADDQFHNLSNVSGWDVSNVTKMEKTFYRNRNNFNPNIGAWDVSNVTNMGRMFYFADSAAFNPDLSQWCVTNITSEPVQFTSLDTTQWPTARRPVWGTCP